MSLLCSSQTKNSKVIRQQSPSWDKLSLGFNVSEVFFYFFLNITYIFTDGLEYDNSGRSREPRRIYFNHGKGRRRSTEGR